MLINSFPPFLKKEMNKFFNFTESIIRVLTFFKKVFFFIISFSPILGVTDDSGFSSIPDKAHHKWRLSLIQFFWGETTIHVVSVRLYKAEKKFSFLEMTSINTSIIPNDDENEDLLKDCEKTIDDLMKNEDECTLLVNDSLCDEIARHSNRVSVCEAKLNIFTIVILAAVPLGGYDFFISFLDKFISGSLTFSVETILSILILYNVLNLFILIFNYLRSKNFLYAGFEETLNQITDSKEIKKLVYTNKYFNLKQSSKRANLYALYICRIMEFLLISLLLCVILFFFKAKDSQEKFASSEKEYAIYTTKNNFEPYKLDNISLKEVLLQIEKKKFSRLSVLSKKISPKVRDELDKYYDTKIIYVEDPLSNPEETKFLLEK